MVGEGGRFEDAADPRKPARLVPYLCLIPLSTQPHCPSDGGQRNIATRASPDERPLTPASSFCLQSTRARGGSGKNRKFAAKASPRRVLIEAEIIHVTEMTAYLDLYQHRIYSQQ